MRIYVGLFLLLLSSCSPSCLATSKRDDGVDPTVVPGSVRLIRKAPLPKNTQEAAGRAGYDLVEDESYWRSLFDSSSSMVPTASPVQRPTNCPATEMCVGKNDDGSRCLEGKGQCYAATLKFLEGCPTCPLEAADLLKYGKYCGRLNKCSPLEATDPCLDPPPACGSGDDSSSEDTGIDLACKNHDACLDGHIADLLASGGIFDPPNGKDIDPLDRLSCDSTFVSSLFDVYVSSLDSVTGQPTPTLLCDSEFYDPTFGAPINLVGHESILIAAPTCCGDFATIPSCIPGSTKECDKALNLCTQFANSLVAPPPMGIGDDKCATVYATKDKFAQIQIELDAAQALWDSQSIVDYKFVSQNICLCPDYDEVAYLTVLGGDVVSGIFVEDQTKADKEVLDYYNSIEEQFSLVQDAIERKAHAIKVEYDEKHGHPAYIFIDYDGRISDEEYSVRNAELVPITTECGILSYKEYCVDGQYCCNASCGICAPVGGACIQQVCL